MLKGRVAPGTSVAIVGAGPVGLTALLTAQFYAPAQLIAIDAHRRNVARELGATQVVDNSDGKAAERVEALTSGTCVDTAIEAVGVPASFRLCENIVAPGGNIAVLGVHGVKVDLLLERLWSHNITLRTRLVDTVSTAMVFKTVQSGRLQPGALITHRFALREALTAYKVFGEAAANQSLKVIIEA